MAYQPYRGFSWNISSYYPLALQESHSEKELRKEYAKLRSVAMKSLQRMGKSEFAQSQTYRQNVGRFLATSHLKSKKEVARALTDVVRFLSAKGHSVSGMKEIRKQSITTWHEKGYTWVNKTNYEDWTRFLAWYKEARGFVYDVNSASAIFRNMSEEALENFRIYAHRHYQFYKENFDER